MKDIIQISGQLGVEHNIDHSDGWTFPGPFSELIWENQENLDLWIR